MSSGPPPVPGDAPPRSAEAARKAREARRASSVDGKAMPGRDWMAEARVSWPTGNRPSRRSSGQALGARGAFAALVVLVAVLLVIWFFASLFQPFKGDGSGNVRVVISKGAGVGDIGDELERRGVVSSSFFFSLRTPLRPGRRPQAGHLHAQGGNELRRRAGRARQRAAGLNIVTLTIPEGRSRREEWPA